MKLVFQFDNLNAFLWMNGHGPYVWSCYIITFLGIAFLALEPRMQRKRFIKQQQKALTLRTAQDQGISLDEVEG